MTKSHFYGHEFALKAQIKFEVQTLLILPPESPGLEIIQHCFHSFRHLERVTLNAFTHSDMVIDSYNT